MILPKIRGTNLTFSGSPGDWREIALAMIAGRLQTELRLSDRQLRMATWEQISPDGRFFVDRRRGWCRLSEPFARLLAIVAKGIAPTERRMRIFPPSIIPPQRLAPEELPSEGASVERRAIVVYPTDIWKVYDSQKNY